MKYIKTDYAIPYYNMALEYYLLNEKKFDDSYLFFYVHKPSIIIGNHQNAYEEINARYVKENSIYVARRLSGGGAVYHDEGNLNFCFITKRDKNQTIDFARYTAPVLKTLEKLGVSARLSGRNDLCIGEKKISGNSQYLSKSKVMHHGTLMYDVNIENMLKALNVSEMKISSKAISSVRSRVVNLKEYIKEPMSTDEFKDRLIESFFEESTISGEYTLTENDKENVEKLVKDKFGTDSYNLGNRFIFNISKKRKYPAGIVEINLNIAKDVITQIVINGDFFFNKDITEVQEALCGTHFHYGDVEKRLKEINFDDYIANLTSKEMLDLLFF